MKLVYKRIIHTYGIGFLVNKFFDSAVVITPCMVWYSIDSIRKW